jgi:hypothetical protein
MVAAVDPAGILLHHLLYWIPYWRIRIPGDRIVSFTLEETGGKTLPA